MRNTYIYLRSGYPLDADLGVVDYFFNDDDFAPWDILYERQTLTTRRIVPQAGASIALIGKKTDLDFGNLGSLILPRPMIDAAIARHFESPENRDKFKLPPEIRDIRLENGELVIEKR